MSRSRWLRGNGRQSLLVALALSVAACSTPTESAPVTVASTSSPATSTTTSTTTTTTSTTTTTTTTTTTLAPTTTLDATTTTIEPTTTIATEPPLDVYEPTCVVQVQRGDSLTIVARKFDDETVTAESIQAENGLSDDKIFPDQLLDVCVGNGIDDISGETRFEPDDMLLRREIEEQQLKLNELFADYGIRELLVDGISGPVTRQRLCAFRLSHGLPVSTEDMVPGSEEEARLMEATELLVPFNAAVLAERWILVDRACQIMFVGAGPEELTFVFNTSTGEPGYETRDQNRSRIFRYNPASDNGGWHNSSIYPVADDNPLNGNMYKPLYFDRGQAIHGANNVPTTPQSKGCVRLRVEHQDMLIWWLGLADSGPTTSASRINAAVTVQGIWLPR